MKTLLIKLTLCSAMLISVSASGLDIGFPAEDIAKLEKLSGLKVIYEEQLEDATGKIKYELPTVGTKVLAFFKVQIYNVYRFYPIGFTGKIKVNTIVVCEKLTVNEKRVNSYSDFENGRIYISLERYADWGVLLNHEIYRFAEMAMFNNVDYHWEEWTVLNAAGFEYSLSGLPVDIETNPAYREIHKTKPGFVNLYSTASEQNDRAEIFAMLMDPSLLHRMRKLSAADEILKKKISKLAEAMNVFAFANAPKNSYWAKQVMQKEDSIKKDYIRREDDRKTKRLEPYKSTAADFDGAISELTTALLESKKLTDKQKKALCMLSSELANDTDEQLDSAALLTKISAKLTADGGFKFVSADSREAKSAKTVLRGRITSLRKQSMRAEKVTYTLSLTLSALETGRILWTGQANFSKSQGEDDGSGIAEWFSDDVKTVTDKMFASLSSAPSVSDKYKQALCLVADEMANDTDEHINTRYILEQLRVKLFNEAGFNFVDNQSLENVLAAQKMQKSDLYDPEKAAKVLKLIGAKTRLIGRISNARHKDQLSNVVLYRVTMQLADLETNKIIWTDEVEIARKATKSKFR